MIVSAKLNTLLLMSRPPLQLQHAEVACRRYTGGLDSNYAHFIHVTVHPLQGHRCDVCRAMW